MSYSLKVLKDELKMWRQELKDCRRLLTECDDSAAPIFQKSYNECDRVVKDLIKSIRKLKM